MSIKILVWKESVSESEMKWMCNCPRNQSINQTNNPANVGWNDEWICGAIYILTCDWCLSCCWYTHNRTHNICSNWEQTWNIQNVFHEHTKSWAINIEWTTRHQNFILPQTSNEEAPLSCIILWSMETPSRDSSDRF